MSGSWMFWLIQSTGPVVVHVAVPTTGTTPVPTAARKALTDMTSRASRHSRARVARRARPLRLEVDRLRIRLLRNENMGQVLCWRVAAGMLVAHHREWPL